jgi:hypothetical protein
MGQSYPLPVLCFFDHSTAICLANIGKDLLFSVSYTHQPRYEILMLVRRQAVIFEE